MRRPATFLALVLLISGAGWAASVSSPVPGTVDLRGWDFGRSGNVTPQDWLWDPGVLWSPATGGRPETLPSSSLTGPPDLGAAFVRQGQDRLSLATGALRVLVDPKTNYGLRIGALPGAFRVWVNGILVWESGVVTADPERFRADGRGTLLTVQPRDGILDIVVEAVSSDPLVRHPEVNRLWVIGPAGSMMDDEWAEKNWRALQAAVLLLGIGLFLWLFRLNPDRKSLVWFVAFLGACLAKLVFNVEQPQPFLAPLFPGIPLWVYLYLNHGLNLLPFPLMVHFLAKQFPEDIGLRSATVVWAVTAVATAWELLPFVLLSFGAFEAYTAVIHSFWSFFLNVFVVLGILFIFERIHLVFQRRRPLSRSLFFGGLFFGVIVLLPVLLSFFMPVRHTYFLGWGMFLFLAFLGIELIRLQLRTSQEALRAARDRAEALQSLGRFLAPEWAPRLGRPSLEDLRPGDSRSSESILVRITAEGDPRSWLPAVGSLASARQALLAEWREGSGTWVLDTWSETALAFALEVQARLASQPGTRPRIVLTRSVVHFTLMDLKGQWLPVTSGIPAGRLEALDDLSRRFGASILLDAALQDGLVIGGWKRHRLLTVSGTEIELYQGEEEALALLKDKSIDAYEAALAQARAGRYDEAVKILFPVVQQNPFDQAARSLLTEWGPRRPL